MRCLEPIDDEVDVTFQELFVYDDPARRAADDDELTTRSARSRTTCSTSSPCCGTRWCSHCRSSPLCEDDCPGLCAECGARLADDPDHAHEAPIDPRWAGLAALTRTRAPQTDAPRLTVRSRSGTKQRGDNSGCPEAEDVAQQHAPPPLAVEGRRAPPW